MDVSAMSPESFAATQVLSTVKGGSDKIVKFVFGDGLPNTIRTIAGDDAIDSAIHALSTESNFPRARIDSAINHLERAHISYEKIYNSINNLNDYHLRWHSADAAILKDLLVCALMTMCYMANEDYPAARKIIECGKEVIQKKGEIERIGSKKTYIWNTPALFAGTGNFVSAFKDVLKYGVNLPGMEPKEYQEFYEVAKQMLEF